jgi:hypothetical protein
VGAVLVADHGHERDLAYEGILPLSSTSPRKASRRSATRLATLDGAPIQTGVATMRMSEPTMRARMAGQPSPRPSSLSTPGRTSWSTTLIVSVLTSCSARASASTPIMRSVLDGAGLGFSVQFRARARSAMRGSSAVATGMPV